MFSESSSRANFWRTRNTRFELLETAWVSWAPRAARIVAILVFSAMGLELSARQLGPYSVRLDPSVPVVMGDGINLSTDLYFPEPAVAELPGILISTMYGKNSFRAPDSDARFFASHGYVVAVQDVRGRYESEGEWDTYRNLAADASAAVTWLATRDWSNGRVGTYGCSFLGDAQVFLATQRNPSHAAMIAQAPGGNYRFIGPYNDGVVELALGFGWLRSDNYTMRWEPPAGVDRAVVRQFRHLYDGRPKLPDIDYNQIWKSLPLVDMMRRSGAGPNVWDAWLAHEPADAWFDAVRITQTDRFDVPSLHVNTWYDYGAGATIEQMQQMTRNATSQQARDNQYLVMGPTTHCAFHGATAETVVGQRPMGDARYDYHELYLDWFGHWLKGEQTGLRQRAKFQYFLMGRGEWRAADAYPVPGTQFVPFYLRSKGNANSRFGDGALSRTRPTKEHSDRYRYDPDAPVPSVGGPLCCTGSAESPSGAFDQRAVEARHDVLVYTTPALEEGLEVTGPLELVVFVSSSAPDTDFTAKLVDVYPDGTAYNVQEGIARARYRQGLDREVFMLPGGVYEVRINLNATGNWFGRGHRIRLEVSSSSFPRWERNLNLGTVNRREAGWQIADNVVHHSARYPSRLVLPVVPEGASRKISRAVAAQQP